MNVLLYARSKAATNEFNTNQTGRDENAQNADESKDLQHPSLVGSQEGSVPRQEIKERLSNDETTQDEDMSNTAKETASSHHCCTPEEPLYWQNSEQAAAEQTPYTAHVDINLTSFEEKTGSSQVRFSQFVGDAQPT